jgi:hypothetical protein
VATFGARPACEIIRGEVFYGEMNLRFCSEGARLQAFYHPKKTGAPFVRSFTSFLCASRPLSIQIMHLIG